MFRSIDIPGATLHIDPQGKRVMRLTVDIGATAKTGDQIDRYNPPPNPAKLTDSRFGGYAAEHGDESWELDALEPRVLNQLIRDAVAKYRDDAKWTANLAKDSENRSTMQNIVDNYDSVVEYLKRQ